MHISLQREMYIKQNKQKTQQQQEINWHMIHELNLVNLFKKKLFLIVHTIREQAVTMSGKQAVTMSGKLI